MFSNCPLFTKSPRLRSGQGPGHTCPNPGLTSPLASHLSLTSSPLGPCLSLTDSPCVCVQEVEGRKIISLLKNSGWQIPWCNGATILCQQHIVRFKLDKKTVRYVHFDDILEKLNCNFRDTNFILAVWHRLEAKLKLLVGNMIRDGMAQVGADGQIEFQPWVTNRWLQPDWNGDTRPASGDALYGR